MKQQAINPKMCLCVNYLRPQHDWGTSVYMCCITLKSNWSKILHLTYVDCDASQIYLHFVTSSRNFDCNTYFTIAQLLLLLIKIL